MQYMPILKTISKTVISCYNKQPIIHLRVLLNCSGSGAKSIVKVPNQTPDGQTFTTEQCTSPSLFPVQYTTPPYIFFRIKDNIGWSCVLNCFMLSSLPVSMLFADLLSLPTSRDIFNVFFFIFINNIALYNLNNNYD